MSVCSLAEFSAVLGNDAKCVGGVLWDTKGPDPEFTPEGREPDKEIYKSAQSVDVYTTLHTVMTTFPFLCPVSTYR